MANLSQPPIPLFDSFSKIISAHKHEALEEYLPQKVLQRTDFIEDYKKATLFIYSYRGSQDTFAAYRREVERLLQWAWFILEKPLRAIKRDEFETFVEFCQQPPLPWIGIKTANRFIEKEGERIPNPEWRPFVVKVSKDAYRKGKMPDPKDYQLSQSALQAIFSILSSFYNFLMQEDYTDINPVAQIRQKSKFLRKRQGKPKIRRLPELQWQYVIETAEGLARKDPDKHERTLFIMNSFYAMYLRVSELTQTSRWTPEMGDFQMDLDGNWWFSTVGKGNKQRDISVSDNMLNALKRYRRFLNLSPLPPPGDNTPLISKQNGNGPISSTRHIRSIVQYCFDQAIEKLKKDDLTEDADMLMVATVHWLRHTGISDDVKQRPREHVRDDAGHSSSAITDKYIDINLRERHASAKNKRIKPLELPEDQE